MNLLSELQNAGRQLGSNAIGAATQVAQKQIESISGVKVEGVQSKPAPSIPDLMAAMQGQAMQPSLGVPNIVWIGLGVIALAFIYKKVK